MFGCLSLSVCLVMCIQLCELREFSARSVVKCVAGYMFECLNFTQHKALALAVLQGGKAISKKKLP